MSLPLHWAAAVDVEIDARFDRLLGGGAHRQGADRHRLGAARAWNGASMP